MFPQTGGPRAPHPRPAAMRALWSCLVACVATFLLVLLCGRWSLRAGVPGHCLLTGRSVTFCELERLHRCGPGAYKCLRNSDGSIGAVDRFGLDELRAYYRDRRVSQWSYLIAAAMASLLHAYDRLWRALFKWGADAARQLHPLKFY